MTTCALVNIANGVVENLIVAEADDQIDEGYLLVVNPPSFVEIGVKWDGKQFIDPHPTNKPAPIAGVETL